MEYLLMVIKKVSDSGKNRQFWKWIWDEIFAPILAMGILYFPIVILGAGIVYIIYLVIR